MCYWYLRYLGIRFNCQQYLTRIKHIHSCHGCMNGHGGYEIHWCFPCGPASARNDLMMLNQSILVLEILNIFNYKKHKSSIFQKTQRLWCCSTSNQVPKSPWPLKTAVLIYRLATLSSWYKSWRTNGQWLPRLDKAAFFRIKLDSNCLQVQVQVFERVVFGFSCTRLHHVTPVTEGPYYLKTDHWNERWLSKISCTSWSSHPEDHKMTWEPS